MGGRICYAWVPYRFGVDNDYHIVALSSKRFKDIQKTPEASVDRAEFSHFRKMLNKTQKQMGQLLGTSVKAVQGYEQGWRSVPAHVERQVLFLVSWMNRNNMSAKSCWAVKKCPLIRKEQCPAWEFQAGTFCWFINGTFCDGEIQKNWKEKMKLCRECEMMDLLRHLDTE